MAKDVSDYISLIKEMFEREDVKAKIQMYSKIDKMMASDFAVPDQFAQLPWIGDRKLVSTAPADSVNAATRAFAARMPNISVVPLNSSQLEYARVERMEHALEWELKTLNRKGGKPVQWKVIDSAMRHCKVALQVEYLPWTMKDYEDGVYKKAVLRSGAFNWILHHPATVFAYEGAHGLPEFVVKKSEYTAAWLRSKYGDSNEGVKQMMDGIKDKTESLKKKMWYFDVTTWEERIQYASEDESGDTKVYVFLKEKHNLPFFPWVIVDNDDPILKSVYEAGLWDISNIIRTIVYSKAMDMAARPGMWISTMSGDLNNVYIDNENPSQPIVTDKTAEVHALPPPQIDQQLASIQQVTDSDIFRSSVAEVLVSIQDMGQTSTFSTVNAMLQAALTQLVLAKNTAERALQLAFHQSLEYVAHTGIDWRLYRTSTKQVGSWQARKGDEIIITNKQEGEFPEDEVYVQTPFSPETLLINVELKSVNIVDEQAQQNLAINEHDRLGASLSLLYDKYGLGDYEHHQAQRSFEDLYQAEIQAEATRITMQPEIEAQIDAEERALEKQDAMEPDPAQQALDEEQAMIAAQNAVPTEGMAPPGFESQQGVDTRMGAFPPSGAIPGEAGGGELAGENPAERMMQ